LQQEAFVFTVPALFDPNIQQFVKETCSKNTDIMYPLVRVPIGESITILNLYGCPADSGNPRSNFPYAYAKIRTAQGIVGHVLTTPNMRAAVTAYLTQIQSSDSKSQTPVPSNSTSPKDSSNLNAR